MPEGKPCVGCGYCCKTSMCRTGAMIYGHYKDPCPALVSTGRGYECRLYLSDPDRYGAFLEIGSGCSFPLNPLRLCPPEKETDRSDTADRRGHGEIEEEK